MSISTSANFFSIKKKLSDKAVEDLFVALRATHGVTGHNEFKHTRENLGGARWSAICFRYEGAPAFLDEATDIRETLCGFLMLVEYEKYAAVLHARLGLLPSFKTKYLAAVPTARVEGAIATADAIFQKMRMRNMSVSPYAMQNKTLEAPNLANVVGPGGSRRYAPRNYSVLSGGSQRSATPSTGRISIRSARVNLAGAVDFVITVINALRDDNPAVSPFIKSFARPVTLAEALEASEPTAIAIDTTVLAEAFDSNGTGIRLVREAEGIIELSAEELTVLIEQLERPLDISGDGRVRTADDPASGEEVASIALNKNRIALRSLSQAPASEVLVESLGVPLGEDDDRKSLREYLDEANALIVLFDDVRLAYIDGQVFRDETLLDGGDGFLQYFRADASLSNVTSEKGEFTATHTAFDQTCTFGAIVDHIGANDAILLCDDLGDEWADFIGLKEEAGLTQVCFYHAKHGALSLGASPFHVSVSQAIKNLGNMTFPENSMQAKLQTWGALYVAPNQTTQIPRTIRSNAPDLAAALSRTRTAPDVMRRAVIVTSSVSRQAIADAFAAIQNGQKPSPSFVQLYWLLQSFFSACTEVGATGSIVCQP
ncbi:hypothetical protein [Rhizobium leguminosarum]|uniref:hypothetical protein n=1 Tax=Rhizobium leguminosarum TaxID=384 RepID=UPI001FE1D0DF|nr:hypothetical protein [Rhizobium leguminosarum]